MEDEEGEEQVGGGAMPQEESRPDGEPAGRGQPVGGQEEGLAGADPAAAGGDEPARLQRPHGRADGPDTDEHLDADHGEHDDHLLLLVVQLRAPPDANRVDALLREPAADEPEHGAAGAWKSEHRRTFGISVIWSDTRVK